jgi:hypothetical protein
MFMALWADRPTCRTEALMSAPAALADTIDLERYPIDDLDGPLARTLVGRCRQQLGSVGACELEGFLRADAVADAVRSVQGLQSLASAPRRRTIRAGGDLAGRSGAPGRPDRDDC